MKQPIAFTLMTFIDLSLERHNILFKINYEES
jgi:hypothetical protein